MSSLGNKIKDNNHGTSVDLAVWITLTVSSLTVLSKLLSKIARDNRVVIRNLQIDDFTITIALISAIVQSVLTSQQVIAGLGQQRESLDPNKISQYEKLGFSSQFFYVLTLAAAKEAGFLFALFLKPSREYTRIWKGFLALIPCYAITTIFCIAFQCAAPHTWEIVTSQKCISRSGFWTFFEIMNILTDLFLIAALCFIIYGLQMANAKKTTLMIAFATRILSIAGAVARVVYIFRRDGSSSSGSPDVTFKEANVAIVTAVTMNINIIVTCVPFLKPFMESLQLGWSTSDVRLGAGYNTLYGATSKFSSRYPTGSVISGNHNIQSQITVKHSISLRNVGSSTQGQE